MRTGTYHRRPARTAWALLVWSALAVTPAHAADGPLAEAWVRVDDAVDVRRLAAEPLTVSEGRRVDADGHLEQRVIASEAVLARLRARGHAVHITRTDHRLGTPRGAYRPPDDGDERLVALADLTPRGGIVTLGRSIQGRPITGLWLGRPPAHGAPTWRVLGGHHGDEWSSTEVALDLAETLVALDGEDAEITALLDTSTVLVVPYVNPDGVVAGSRYNASGVDLNRNYDFEWSPNAFRSGSAPFSEPETRAIRTHAAWSPPLASLSVHSGAVNLGYVWNHSHTPTPEASWLAGIAEDYAATCTAPGFEATNGAAWYITHGDTNDWSYGRYGGMDFTLEVSTPKAPPDEHLPTVLDWHRDAILAFLSEPVTLAGRVVDAETGAPLHAALTLHGEDGAVPLTTHPGAGTFARAAVPGSWTLTATAPGYAPLDTTIEVGDRAALDLELALQPVPVAAEPPSPRRLSGHTLVTLPGADDGPARVHRPGHATQHVEVEGGAALIDATRLAPGPWSISTDGGVHWPAGIVVDDDGPAALHDLVEGDAEVRVEGEAFGVGSRAWALVGPRRVPVGLPVLDESPDWLVLDTTPLRTDDDVDLVVVSNGTHLVALDLEVEPPPLEVLLLRGTCGCASGPTLPAPLALLPLLLLTRRRRS